MSSGNMHKKNDSVKLTGRKTNSRSPSVAGATSLKYFFYLYGAKNEETFK